MDLRKAIRNPGWSRAFKVFLWLWYGVYIFVMGGAFIMNDWQLKVNETFLPVLVIWVVSPWVLLFFMRLIRYGIEGFMPEREWLWISLWVWKVIHTHKRYRISCSTYSKTCSSQAPPVHNAIALNTAPPVVLLAVRQRDQQPGSFLIMIQRKPWAYGLPKLLLQSLCRCWLW